MEYLRDLRRSPVQKKKKRGQKKKPLGKIIDFFFSILTFLVRPSFTFRCMFWLVHQCICRNKLQFPAEKHTQSQCSITEGKKLQRKQSHRDCGLKIRQLVPLHPNMWTSHKMISGTSHKAYKYNHLWKSFWNECLKAIKGVGKYSCRL